MGQLLVVSSAGQLAQLLRARRRQLRLPLRVVGDRAGMVLQSVWQVEQGYTRPGPDVLLRITGALDCQVMLHQMGPSGRVYR